MVMARTLAFLLLVGSASVLASDDCELPVQSSEVDADEGASHSEQIECMERQLEALQLLVEQQLEENSRLERLIESDEDAVRRKRAYEALAKGGLAKEKEDE